MTLVKVFPPLFFADVVVVAVYFDGGKREPGKTWLEGSLNVTRPCIDRVIELSIRAELDEAKPSSEFSRLYSVFAARDQFPRNVSSGVVRGGTADGGNRVKRSIPSLN